jgi:hypothetical protein
MERARQSVISYWNEYLDKYIAEADLLRGVYAPEHYENGRKELREALTEQLRETGFEFKPPEIEEICSRIDMDDVVSRNIEWDQGAPVSGDYQGPATRREVEDQLIDDLFERDGP